MQISIEVAGGCKRIIKAEVPADHVTEKLAEGFRDINRQVQFPGFRKGKAPKHMLEKRFGREVSDDVRQTLAEEVVTKAREEHALKILGNVEMVEAADLKSNAPARFVLEAEVYPEFELPEYKGLELQRPTPKAEEHEIHAVMRSDQVQQGELKPVEGGASKGQFLRAAVNVKVGEELILNRRSGMLEVGQAWVAGLQPAGAAEALVGKKAGDKLELKATLPADFPRVDFQGKEAVIEVEVHEVLKYEGPDLEEVAKKRGMESLDAWKEDIRAKLLSDKEAELDRVIEERALQTVAEKTSMELPERFSRRKAAELVQQQAYRMYQAGTPEEDVRDFLNANKDKGVDEVKGMLKRAFVMDAIAKKERLVVTEDEVKREVARVAAQVGRDVDEVFTQLNQDGTLNGMREELKTGKVLKLLRQKAKYV